MIQVCWICGKPGVALWYYDQTGFRKWLCKRDLDVWLDNADNNPALEPTRLEFRHEPVR